MESDEIREAMLEADRAAAAPWVEYPPTPRWWPYLFAAWTLVFALNIGYVDGLPQALGTLLLAIVMGVVTGWQRLRRGTYPTGRGPRELRASFVYLIVGAGVIALVAWLTSMTVAPWLGAIAAAILAFFLITTYERVYERAAEQIRARLR